MLVPVILSGGAGTRLWPLSRELYPKQLLPLVGKHTMLQDTVLRLQGVAAQKSIVVCNDAHRFLVAEQLRQIEQSAQAIVLEPVGRNTAPAIALAAQAALAAGAAADPVLLVLPADHVIRNLAAFQSAVTSALQYASADALVTFGVVPSGPETGYGYIQRGVASGAAFRIERFVEKPGLEKAQEFLTSGQYYWNSGMFMFRARRYLEELQRLAPDIAKVCAAAFAGARSDQDFARVDAKLFSDCRSESIDYAVMEKTTAAVVVPLDAGWSDVGSWSALHDASEVDANGNVLRGDVLAEDTHGSFIYSESRLVSTLGLTDHVVVETKDAILVAPKSRVQDVKLLVAKLRQSGRSEFSLHREVHRPWGSYDSLDNGPRHQVKHIIVKPGGVLSLQLHHHRAEHWVVVSGTARVTRGDEVIILEENQSTYIPIGMKHRVENTGAVPLHLIEVQSGDYLGEDDIVRFEDQYGRQGTNT